MHHTINHSTSTTYKDIVMKLITPEQHAKIRLRYEILASALLSTIIVSVAFALTSPISYTLTERLSIA